MVLTGVTLFPQSLLPLYIFEPRYRQMLKDSLEGDRLFGVVSFDHLMAQKDPKNNHVDIIAGVGMIRACVEQEDGTSQLILQGVARVRLTEFIQSTPVLISKVEPLTSINCDSIEVDALAGRLCELIVEMTVQNSTLPSHVMEYLQKTKDPDILSDLISYLILKKADYRQDILSTLDLCERYRKLLRMVPEELSLQSALKTSKKSSRKKKP